MLYERMIAAVMVSVVLMPSVASAGGLLGGVLGIIGDGDSGALATVNSGNAGDSGLVNVGAGGSNGAVTANVGGGSSPVVDASVLGSDGIADVNANPSQLMELFQKSSTRGWNRASGIQLIPIKVCANLRRQMANWPAANGEYHRMAGAVTQDPLINAALSRTQYRPGHVLGVHTRGRR